MGFCLLCVHLVVHVHLFLLFGQGVPACCEATLKSGIWNWNEIKNQNPESLVKENKVFKLKTNAMIEYRITNLKEISIAVLSPS